MEVESTVTVLVTGAAGRIGYSLIPMILGGTIFGSKRIILKLFDIPQAKDKLHGLKMEVEDSDYDSLQELIVSVDIEEAFSDVEVAVLIGGYPRLPGMERRDLLIKNAESIKSQALALNQYGSKNTKVLVVANPANTNCLVAIKQCPNIPPENFTCLTRLDQERLRGFCAAKASETLGYHVHSREVRNVQIFGNHSTTQVAYVEEGTVQTREGQRVSINSLMSHEHDYDTLLNQVQHRGAAIIKALQVSSAMSAAEAVSKHLRDWLGPVLPNQPFSMGVLSNGNPYGVPDDLVFSFPCVRRTVGGFRIMTLFSF